VGSGDLIRPAGLNLPSAFNLTFHNQILVVPVDPAGVVMEVDVTAS
jgi:hypothetical protein